MVLSSRLDVPPRSFSAGASLLTARRRDRYALCHSVTLAISQSGTRANGHFVH